LDQPTIYRIDATCDIDNIGSAAALERAGFVRDGILRCWIVHPNVSDDPRDSYSYARMR
jgi:[ribosomal protein S5]-alanine N-acetyltransferase